MLPSTIDLNLLRRWLADANAAFQAQEHIAYQDMGNRQTCLNDFVLFLLKQAQDEGAVETVPPAETI